MPMSKEEKARRRAMLAMEAGRSFHARGSSNKARLHELRTEAASSSSKRIRVEQIEAAPAAPAPAAPLAGEEEAAEEEKEEVRPEAIELAAPAGSAPAESFATNLAKRAAQALAKQRGIQTPPLPPPWFEGHVLAFYSRSEAFNSELRALQKPFHAEVDKEQTTERKRCRRCKKEGYSAAEPYMICERHEWPPADYSDRLKRLEAPVYDKFAAEAAQWALDQKSADDRLERVRQRQEDCARHEREARRARTLESMEPLCLRCAFCFHLDFGFTGRGPEQMCRKHLEQYRLACGP